MRRLKKVLWKASSTITVMIFLLVPLTWVSVAAADIHEAKWESAKPGTATMQATPTEDATVTALNKEKLAFAQPGTRYRVQRVVSACS